MRYGDMRGEAGRENDRLEPWLKSCPRLDGAALDDRRARGGGAETECCGGNGRDNEGCPVAGGTDNESDGCAAPAAGGNGENMRDFGDEAA